MFSSDADNVWRWWYYCYSIRNRIIQNGLVNVYTQFFFFFTKTILTRAHATCAGVLQRSWLACAFEGPCAAAAVRARVDGGVSGEHNTPRRSVGNRCRRRFTRCLKINGLACFVRNAASSSVSDNSCRQGLMPPRPCSIRLTRASRLFTSLSAPFCTIHEPQCHN